MAKVKQGKGYKGWGHGRMAGLFYNVWLGWSLVRGSFERDPKGVSDCRGCWAQALERSGLGVFKEPWEAVWQNGGRKGEEWEMRRQRPHHGGLWWWPHHGGHSTLSEEGATGGFEQGGRRSDLLLTG